jgi:hypothetical protein
LPQRFLESPALAQKTFGFLAQGIADLVEGQLVADPVEQGHVEGMLEIQQGLAGCRLRHVEALCRAGDVLVSGHRQEDLQLPECVLHLVSPDDLLRLYRLNR